MSLKNEPQVYLTGTNRTRGPCSIGDEICPRLQRRGGRSEPHRRSWRATGPTTCLCMRQSEHPDTAGLRICHNVSDIEPETHAGAGVSVGDLGRTVKHCHSLVRAAAQQPCQRLPVHLPALANLPRPLQGTVARCGDAASRALPPLPPLGVLLLFCHLGADRPASRKVVGHARWVNPAFFPLTIV